MAAVFWHVGLTVADMNRSVAFYRDVVEMREGEHQFSANEASGRLVNNPGATLASVFLTLDGFTLQLLQYFTQAGVRLDVAHNNAGSPHFSFFVPDVDEKYQALSARGDVEITSPIVANQSGTIRSFYIADPDGVPVEFVERVSGTG
jgi:catechol 2,3-dioxygenase-like lactoylglutathione lyase family enzyme